MDLQLIHQFLSSSYWSKGISIHVLNKAIKNSLCFAVVNEQNVQVGFARMITDRATFAYLADVFILEKYRGNGLSKLLIKEILDHKDLQSLRRIVLATRDAHALYEQFGFSKLSNPQTFMEIWKPEVYQS